ncbi:hypothetical protein FQN54_004638 [Arachnomyces sp. PD_36]|nr:hypothetical protein FQN54_004638 [Arachnomyces sp. PD_36]
MASADLTSHHVNYLIWRYLQESGHGEAAVMLQRAWNPDPQNLPFAQYIKTHALVTLVQKGLQYHEVEQSLDQAGYDKCDISADSNKSLQNGNPVPLTPAKLFFGPDSLEPVPSPVTYGAHREPTEGSVGTDHPPRSPKPISEDIIKEDAVNGHVNEVATQPESNEEPQASTPNGRPTDREENAMDIDHQNGTAHEGASIKGASPSPTDAAVDADGDVDMAMGAGMGPGVGVGSTVSETPTDQEQQNFQEPPTPTFTLTTGHSVGVQITPAKAADLDPHTNILAVAGDAHVTKALWRPHDPTILAEMGESFCGLWKLSSQRSEGAPAPAHEPLVNCKGDSDCVTGAAWDPTGTMLAVATYSDLSGSITMYNTQGAAVDLLPDVPRMISGLHWAEKGHQMVIVVSDGENSELVLWDQSIRPEEFPPPQQITGNIYDVAWSGDDEIYASGDDCVYQCHVDTSIHITKTIDSDNAGGAWTFVKSMKRPGSTMVVAASSETTNLWVPTHDMRHNSAHLANITAIELRPQPSVELQQSSPAILATASMDETVKIWNIDLESKQFTCLHRLVLGQDSPALSASFSADGYAIAAASTSKLLIWNAERGGTPMATWTVPDAEKKDEEVKKDGVPATNGEEAADAEALDRPLSWDSDGKRLALGFGKQMAIVNLQR